MSLTTNDLFCVCMHVCEMCDKTLKKCRLYPISARKRHDVIMRARPVDRSEIAARAKPQKIAVLRGCMHAKPKVVIFVNCVYSDSTHYCSWCRRDKS